MEDPATKNKLSPFMGFVGHLVQVLALALACAALGPASALRLEGPELLFRFRFFGLALVLAVGAACLIALHLSITKRGASSVKWAIMATAFAFAASFVPGFGIIGLGSLLLVVLGHSLARWIRGW